MNIKDLFTKKLHILVLIYLLFNFYQSWSSYQSEKKAVSDQLPLMEGKVAQLKERNKKAKLFQENLEASKRRIQEVSEQIEKVQRRLPNTISDTDILQLFSQTASELKVADVSQRSLQEAKRDFYFTRSYGFKAVGTYLQFLVFFEQLARDEKLSNVTNMSMKANTEKKKGRYQLVNMEASIETFRYEPPASMGSSG